MSRVFEAYQEDLWATLQMRFEDYQRLKAEESYQEIKLSKNDNNTMPIRKLQKS
jgi:hypothetical protein